MGGEVTREVATVAVASDGQPALVREAFCHKFVDRLDDVAEIRLTPASDRGGQELLAVTLAAPRVDGEHDPALRGQQLVMEIDLVDCRPPPAVRTTMDLEQQRLRPADRLVGEQPAVELLPVDGAERALELAEQLDIAETFLLQAGSRGVAAVAQVDRVDLAEQLGGIQDGGNHRALRHREAEHRCAGAGQPGLAAGFQIEHAQRDVTAISNAVHDPAAVLDEPRRAAGVAGVDAGDRALGRTELLDLAIGDPDSEQPGQADLDVAAADHEQRSAVRVPAQLPEPAAGRPDRPRPRASLGNIDQIARALPRDIRIRLRIGGKRDRGAVW